MEYKEIRSSDLENKRACRKCDEIVPKCCAREMSCDRLSQLWTSLWEVFLLCTSNDREWDDVTKGRQLFDERTPLLSSVVICDKAVRRYKTKVSNNQISSLMSYIVFALV